VVTGEAITSIAITMLVLAGLIPDNLSLRIALSAGLILLLTTIAVRIAVDVIRATSATPPATEPAKRPSAPLRKASSLATHQPPDAIASNCWQNSRHDDAEPYCRLCLT
jgi:hypothetical protein